MLVISKIRTSSGNFMFDIWLVPFLEAAIERCSRKQLFLMFQYMLTDQNPFYKVQICQSVISLKVSSRNALFFLETVIRKTFPSTTEPVWCKERYRKDMHVFCIRRREGGVHTFAQNTWNKVDVNISQCLK